MGMGGEGTYVGRSVAADVGRLEGLVVVVVAIVIASWVAVICVSARGARATVTAAVA